MYQAFPVSHIFHWFSHFPTFYQHPNFPCDSPIFWHSSATIFPYSFLLWFSTDLDYGFIVVPLFFHMLTFEVPICSHMISSYFHIFLEFPTAFHPWSSPKKKKKKLEKNLGGFPRKIRDFRAVLPRAWQRSAQGPCTPLLHRPSNLRDQPRESRNSRRNSKMGKSMGNHRSNLENIRKMIG